MATAFTATLLVSAALRGVVGHLVKGQDEPLPNVDVLRYSTALNYTVLGVAVMGTFALLAISMGVLVLRTGVVARWAAFVSLGCGVVVLGAVAVLMGAFSIPVALLWALCISAAIWRAPVPAEITQPDGARAEVLT